MPLNSVWVAQHQNTDTDSFSFRQCVAVYWKQELYLTKEENLVANQITINALWAVYANFKKFDFPICCHMSTPTHLPAKVCGGTPVI